MPKISQEKRLAVKQIIVDQWEAPRKTKIPYYRDNVRLRVDRKTKKKKESIARKFLDEYLQDSSLHGVKYLSNVEIKSSIIEKICWAVIMICSFVFLIWMIIQFWTRYKDDTLRTVVENFFAPISLIPFPAVTLCPLIPPLVERRRKLLERLRLPHGIDNETAMFLFKYGPAFTSEQVQGGKIYLNKMKTLLKFNHMTLTDMLMLLRPCEDLLDSCWWNSEQRNCSTMFKISFTFQGLCCSFNYLLEDNPKKISFDNYNNYRRTASYGSISGLTVVLHRNLLVEDDGTGDLIRYSTNSIGILVFCHHPFEFLGPISNRHLLQAQQELRIAVQPKINKKLPGYYRRDVHDNIIPHCLDDIKLKYLPVPLYANCFIDCSIEASLRLCDCVPFYYMPVAIKHSLRICDWDDFECLYENSNNIRIITNVQNDSISCQCHTPCTNLHYETSTSLGILNKQSCNVMLTHQNLTDAQAIVKVYMDAETFTINGMIPVADELYLLASVGGIFSLFVGCSFISAIEIAYFIGLFLRSYYKSK